MATIDIAAQNEKFQNDFEIILNFGKALRDLGESICWLEDEAEIDSEKFTELLEEMSSIKENTTDAMCACWRRIDSK
jgi:hypothetical protein